jgi:hypothetical protein
MSTGSAVDTSAGGDDIFTTPCPTDSVPLHQVCDSCQHFFDTWKAFDILENWDEAACKRWSGTFELCTIAHLLQSQEACHFCNMVLSRFNDRDLLDLTRTVMLYARDGEYKGVYDDEEPGYIWVHVGLRCSGVKREPQLCIEAFNFKLLSSLRNIYTI